MDAADISENICSAAARFLSDLNSFLVDFFHLLLQPVTSELNIVGAIRVRLDDVCASIDICFMDILDLLRMRQVQFFKTPVHAVRIKNRAHRPVRNQNLFFQLCKYAQIFVTSSCDTVLNACFKSAMISFSCSMPTEARSRRFDNP